MAGGTTGRVLDTPKLNYNEMLLMGVNISQKNSNFGMDLMQNCDLPPPMKVFTRSDRMTVLPSMNRAFGMMGTREGESQSKFDGENHEKLELLKALRFSQTRAREAEKKAEVLAKERDCLSNAVFEEAKQLFGHRQLVRLLELQVSSLYSKWAEKERKGINRDDDDDNDGGKDDDDDDGVCFTWVVALAFCFGIAGVGFAFVCRYLI